MEQRDMSSGAQNERVDIQIKRLDDVLSPDIARMVDFIKIDTEGYQIHVLNGAHRTLSLLLKGAFLMIEAFDAEAAINFLKPYDIILKEHAVNDLPFFKER